MIFDRIFPGQYHDSETGVYYNFHRYYMPEVGRYLREDEVKSDYIYADNNTCFYFDSLGLLSYGYVGKYFYQWGWLENKSGLCCFYMGKWGKKKCPYECPEGFKPNWIQSCFCPGDKYPGWEVDNFLNRPNHPPVYTPPSAFDNPTYYATDGECATNNCELIDGPRGNKKGCDFISCSVCINRETKEIIVKDCFKWGYRPGGIFFPPEKVNFNRSFWIRNYGNYRWREKL